jgi:hypothetical protein
MLSPSVQVNYSNLEQTYSSFTLINFTKFETDIYTIQYRNTHNKLIKQ